MKINLGHILWYKPKQEYRQRSCQRTLVDVHHCGPPISLRARLPLLRCCTAVPDFLFFLHVNQSTTVVLLASYRDIMSCLDVMYPAYGHYAPYAPKASAFISALPVSMLKTAQCIGNENNMKLSFTKFLFNFKYVFAHK